MKQSESNQNKTTINKDRAREWYGGKGYGASVIDGKATYSILQSGLDSKLKSFCSFQCGITTVPKHAELNSMYLYYSRWVEEMST